MESLRQSWMSSPNTFTTPSGTKCSVTHTTTNTTLDRTNLTRDGRVKYNYEVTSVVTFGNNSKEFTATGNFSTTKRNVEQTAQQLAFHENTEQIRAFIKSVLD